MANSSASTDYQETRTKLVRRWGALKTERSSWISHWQEISNYLLPRSGRYFSQDRNNGNRRHNNIYDNTGSRALKIMAAGMMAGATSPARPWFRLATPDPELNQSQPVKVWLDDVSRRMHAVFQKSNTYRALHQLYEELGAFGTGASIVLPSFDSVIHHYPLTIGEYAIATDWQGNVCTLYREFDKQVSEIVKEFGIKNCSAMVQNLYNKGDGLDKWVTLIHAIEPRADRDASKRDAKNMAWKSCYFELGGNEDKVLREGGFKQFPAVVPRWALAGGDVYGNGPGMESLGDIKQLQHEQLRKANAIDFQTNPPLDVPTALKNQEVNRLPGGITYRDPSTGTQGIKSLFDVNLRLDFLLQDIVDVRGRINSSFFADMFLMLAQQPADGRMTATEVAERHEEKLLMLGPVIERLNNELLYPMVETTFTHMVEGGAIPPAPDDLQGMDLQVEFVSMLAQAQKAIGTNSVDRFVGNLGVIAQMKPDVLDKFDSDKWAESYSDMLGVDPNLIVADDKVALVRDARNKAQAAAQQAATMEQASKAAKNLGSTPTGGAPNALQDMMNQFSGYGSPSGVEV
jgi:hypothetical protein